MKTEIIYECEICGKKSNNFEEIEKCEMEHCGVTKREVIKYDRLYRDMRNKSSTVFFVRNDATIADYDESIKRIIEFEEEHPKIIKYIELAGRYKHRRTLE